MNMPLSRKNFKPGNEPEQRCIWMTAGVISLKLCPLNFDCEHCDFDSVMQLKEKSVCEANQKPEENNDKNKFK